MYCKTSTNSPSILCSVATCILDKLLPVSVDESVLGTNVDSTSTGPSSRTVWYAVSILWMWYPLRVIARPQHWSTIIVFFLASFVRPDLVWFQGRCECVGLYPPMLPTTSWVGVDWFSAVVRQFQILVCLECNLPFGTSYTLMMLKARAYLMMWLHEVNSRVHLLCTREWKR